MLPESYVCGGKAGEFKLDQCWSEGVLQAQIRAGGAEGLKALFFELDYDAGSLTPLRIEGSPSLGQAAEGLQLSLLSRPGRLEYGAMLLRPQEQSGLQGDLLLATVYFSPKPYSAARRVSAPLSSDSSRGSISYNSSSQELSWGYYNHGDYNQDGRVSVGDLTPIGIYFGDSVPVGPGPDMRDNSSIEDVIDGSNDGLINVQDLSAIGQNFGNQVSAYGIYFGDPLTQYPASNSAPSTVAQLTTLPFISGAAATGKRKVYATSVPDIDAAQAYWVRPLDSEGAEGTPSEASLDSNEGGWSLHEIDTGDFAGYRSKLFVRTNFEGSNVPVLLYFRNGTPSAAYCYASDLNLHGEGLHYLTTVSNAGFASDSFTGFSSADGQIFMARQDILTNELLVYNCAGNTLANWLFWRAADTPSDSIESLNGTMALGQPAFSYYRDTPDPNDGLLMFNYYDGANFNPVIVAGGFSTFDTGRYNSLALIEGVPAIAYYDAQAQNLWYIRANDLLGSSWPAGGVQVEAGGIGIDTGLHVVLMEVDGRPAVFYQENGLTSKIMYKRANDSLGSDWPGNGVLVGTSDNPIAESIPFSAATDGSVTGVGYVQGGSLTLRMLSDAAGSFEPEENVVSGPIASPSMAILGGFPAFSVYLDGADDMYFVSKY
ncbi:hypothetical protein IT575_09765 [bacterium]|nr:hypothetical protein [bacterium]